MDRPKKPLPKSSESSAAPTPFVADYPILSAGELELIRILWAVGPATILETQKQFTRPIEYPTVQTRLNRLVVKGWAKKSRVRPARYVATLEPGEISLAQAKQLLETVPPDLLVGLISHLIDRHRFSEADCATLANLLEYKEPHHGN